MKKKIDDLHFSNSFLQLGRDFYALVQPTPFETVCELVHFNPAAAELLGLDEKIHTDAEFIDVVSGRVIPAVTQPYAMLYAGHQFGHYVPQLGDGRAIALGEISGPQNRKWEIQLKGSGQTPYSRDGDGRAVLRSSIREYLCSEAMHGLGIPTTRALCLVHSQDEVYRERIETGAIVTRMAPTHTRFGSFEVFYYRNQHAQLKTLADYIIEQHYPDITDSPQRYVTWLNLVIQRTARLIAQWQSVGFCHGVMNSDNMSVLGLTLDYGPFGFLDQYEPGYICNHSDYQGRYAYDQQPQIGLFNLSCFAQAILPLLSDDPQEAAEIARQQLDHYSEQYHASYQLLMCNKLGLQEYSANGIHLAEHLLNLMRQDKVDFTILFRQLCEFETTEANNNHAIRDLFLQRENFDHWAADYRQLLMSQNEPDATRKMRMKQINPKYILRNYLAEIAIQKAEQQDYSEIDKLFRILQTPFDEHDEYNDYAGFPPDWASHIEVSCSS